MRIICFIIAILFIWSCSESSKKINSNEPSTDFMLLVGEWKNISASDVSVSDDWLGNSLFLNIEENGFIKNNEGQQVQASLHEQCLCIENNGVTVRYKIKSDAGFINVQMIDNNEAMSSYLFKRVQDSLVGVWTCVAEEGFHQVDDDGWVNNDWIWSFQGPLSFYNNHTCINRKGEIAQWEINNSILTIKYKEHYIDWKVTGHYTLTWEKERVGSANKDRHVYSFVASECPTFN